MREASFSKALGGRVTLGAFLVGLLLMSYQVLHLFLVPVAWALILVYVTWPIHRRLRSLLHPYAGLSASLMTLILALVFVLPLLWIIVLLRGEVPMVYADVGLHLALEVVEPGFAQGDVLIVSQAGVWLRVALGVGADVRFGVALGKALKMALTTGAPSFRSRFVGEGC